ncbi:HEPN domain-containing protein [Amaricoccus sp. W119]|uniref:HEPN domain-containing protein n=1 Tax=Amaricoccus sp. W119 TaxID=3391833 RepID=UPI0039A502AA
MRFIFSEDAFQRCLNDASSLLKASAALPSGTQSAALRGALLLAVGAFDFLIHEIIRIEVVDRARSRNGNVRMEIPYSCLTSDGSATLSNEIDLHLRKNNSYKSFVSSSKISDVFKIIDVRIWLTHQELTQKDPRQTKANLDRIWEWRNRIAHEGDFIPSSLNFSYWPVYEIDVHDSINFLRDLGLEFLFVVRNISR